MHGISFRAHQFGVRHARRGVCERLNAPARWRTSISATASALNTLQPPRTAAGWRLLFDGKSTAGWRAYGADTMPTGWQAVDGLLTRVSRAADIITKDQFGDFELTARLEARAGWKQWSLLPGGRGAGVDLSRSTGIRSSSTTPATTTGRIPSPPRDPCTVFTPLHVAS